MPIIQSSGTQTASIGVEQTLANLTSPAAVYQLYVDVSAMLSGDILALKLYTKVLSGGTLNSIAYEQITGAPTGNGDDIWVSAPVYSPIELKATLEQTAGTARNFPWSLVSFP